jgi:4a-hydroxytetrahydrobiopterin dehydratase
MDGSHLLPAEEIQLVGSTTCSLTLIRMMKSRLRNYVVDLISLLYDVSLQRLSSLPLWTINEQGHLCRRFEAKNFQAAMDFLNLAGAAAEAHGHHPDMKLTRYRQVEVSVYTQKLDGITAADFELAQALDALPVEYSAAWKIAHPGR